MLPPRCPAPPPPFPGKAREERNEPQRRGEENDLYSLWPPGVGQCTHVGIMENGLKVLDGRVDAFLREKAVDLCINSDG